MSVAFAADPPPPANAPAASTAGTVPGRAPTLDDLYAERQIVDAAVSPSGHYVALIVRRAGNEDLVVIVDLQARTSKGIQRVRLGDLGKQLEARLSTVYWKSEERLLFRMSVSPVDDKYRTLSDASIRKLGARMFAINRDGSKVVPLFSDNRNAALIGAFDLGAVASFLPNDPEHVLMVLNGFNGASLFKVDLGTGHGEQVERPTENVVGWWLDVDGNPTVRMSAVGGTLSLFRKEADKWKRFMKMRLREMRERPDYELIGPSDQAGKFYVLARPPGHDRVGLYLYELDKENFGEPLFEHASFDLISARASRDGKRIIHYCYLAHVRICEFSDEKLGAHMKAVRKFFADSANVYVYDTSEDGGSLLLFVEGPHDPPAYYYYVSETKRIEPVGPVRGDLKGTVLPSVSIVSYRARDGKELGGYLTLPANAPSGAKLPLVTMPHGGPEMRDHLTFDPWVQFLASRGYAVFQPNFRGSDGFGKAFAESGYGEWGRKMQDDITDGVQKLVDEGLVDPARICIVGASYGGYAALAGAALTPDLFKCAVSIAGITDLDDFIGWRKRNWGRDSEGYTYWLKAIGDPDVNEQRLREVSPVQLVSKISIPVLLIHGVDDGIVPIAQSRDMKKALEKSGRKTELIEIAKEGHSYWSDENEMYALSSIDAFLWKHLGAGTGVTTPPVVRGAPKK